MSAAPWRQAMSYTPRPYGIGLDVDGIDPRQALRILERYIARLRADLGDPNYPGARHEIPADLEHAELRARALRKEIGTA